MEDLRSVRYDSTAEVLEATKAYDDGFTNLSLGSFHDYLRSAAAAVPSEPTYFLALYRGDALLLSLAHHRLSRAWQLVCPQSAEHLLTPALLDAATQQLASSLLAMAHPNVISTVYGHDGAVKAFMKAWATLVEQQGIHLRVADPLMVTHSSYATRESLTPAPPTSSNFVIMSAVEHDFEELFPLYLDFRGVALERIMYPAVERPSRQIHIAPEAMMRRRSASSTDKARGPGPIVSTIAIRSVYVSRDHRRKGVASAMVRAMSRYHLGVRPVGYEGVPDGPPDTGVKDIVCINVAEPDVERIYRRAGFLFPEPAEDGTLRGGRDPVSGLKGWFPSVWLGFKLRSSP